MAFENTIKLIEDYRDNGCLAYSAFAVGDRDGVKFRWCLDGTTENTLFEMASVTKITVSTPLYLLAQSEGLVDWNDRIGDYFDAPSDRADVPLWRLLTHSSGLPPYRIAERISDPADVVSQILHEPLGYEPGSKVVYACQNLILIGKLLEKLYDKPLDLLFREKIGTALGMPGSGYKAPATADIALHQEPRNRANDPNAFFMGNVAGNAGLFSNIVDMSSFATEIAKGLPTLIPHDLFTASIENFTSELNEPRGIGWKLVDRSVDPQTGRLFSKGSYGHCGHTGQSVFADRETGLWTVWMTNATYCNKDYKLVKKMREKFHNTVANDLGI